MTARTEQTLTLLVIALVFLIAVVAWAAVTGPSTGTHTIVKTTEVDE